MPRNPSTTVAPFLTERPGPPGKCVVSGDIDGPFVDMGIRYENRNQYQRLLIHAPIIEQVARDLLGLVPRSEIEALEDRAETAEQEAAALQAAFDALSNAREKVSA